jgi:peptide/nickel transport system substrate-binding protein
MRRTRTAIDRREFLRRGATLGVGALMAPALLRKGWAASKERVVIFQGVGLDSLHPYAYSGGGIVGIWLHMIEPLVHMDFGRNEYVGVLAESWEFQGKKWIFRLRKGIRFHNGSPFTSKDVVFSLSRMKSDKRTSARSRRSGCGRGSGGRLHCGDDDQES